VVLKTALTLDAMVAVVNTAATAAAESAFAAVDVALVNVDRAAVQVRHILLFIAFQA
jgi:hypothetical protein